MIRITTKVGDLFMEAENEREESDRIKLYDSYSRYLEYLPLESVSPYETVAQYCNKVIRRLEECDSVEEIANYLGIETHKISDDWTKLLDDVYGGETYQAPDGKWYKGFEQECITEQNLLDLDFVNVIGSTYILLKE